MTHPLSPSLSASQWGAAVEALGADTAQTMAAALTRRVGAVHAASTFLTMLSADTAGELDRAQSLAALPTMSERVRMTVRTPDEWTPALEALTHDMTPAALLEAGAITDATEAIRWAVASVITLGEPLDVEPPSGGMPKVLWVSASLHAELEAALEGLRTAGQVGGRSGVSSAVRFALAKALALRAQHAG